MYMNVWELSRDQISELKFGYYYDILEESDAEKYATWDDIPDQIIFEHYKHTIFVNDDFGCTAGEE